MADQADHRNRGKVDRLAIMERESRIGALDLGGAQQSEMVIERDPPVRILEAGRVDAGLREQIGAPGAAGDRQLDDPSRYAPRDAGSAHAASCKHDFHA